MMLKIVLSYLCLLVFSLPVHIEEKGISGAWKDDNGVFIFTEKYFTYTAYTSNDFNYTYGGKWKPEGKNIIMTIEYDTKNADQVGKDLKKPFRFNSNRLTLDGVALNRVDDGTPGKLAGAWLFSTRVENGTPGERRSGDLPRKTMKILSGTRFQWIAYNTETKEFFGTGGGSYTSENGKYTEKIEFFSRDNSRVGASLEFEFKIDGDDWHHEGLNSRGEPMYEIWAKRK